MAKNDINFGVGIDVDISDINRQIGRLGELTREQLKALNQALGGDVVKRLVIKTEGDSSGAKKLVAQYEEVLTAVDAVVNKQKQLDKIQQGSVTSLRQQVNQAKQARDEIAKYETKIGAFGGSVRTITDSWAAQNQKVQELQRSLDIASASGFWDTAKANLNIKGLASFANGLTQLTNGLQAASIVVGQVFSSVNGLINALGELQAFKLSFEAIGQGAGGAATALGESSRIALGLGVDLNTVREGFRQLTPVIVNSGGTIGDVSNVVEALSSRFAAFGVSGDKARRVTNGIIQAFAKGKLMAEELTQQISEADPAFKTDFAKAVGVSVTELEELVKAGKITSDVLINKLPGISKSSLLFGRLGVTAIDAAESIKTAGTTIDQARSNINTINQLSFERFAKAFQPLIVEFVVFQGVIANFLERLSKLQGIDSLGSVLGKIGSTLNGVTQGALRLTETILSLVGGILRLVDVLFKIPILGDLISVAIVGKMIAPFLKFGAVLGNFALGAGALKKTFDTLSSWEGVSQAFQSIGKSARGTKQEIAALTAANSGLIAKAKGYQKGIDVITGKISEYDKKIESTKAIAPQFLAKQEKQRQIDEYIKKQQMLRDGAGRVAEALSGLDTKIAANGARLEELAAKKGIAAKAGNVLKASIQGLGAAASSLISGIGPLQLALIGITVAMAAYENASKKSNAIIEASAQRVDALKTAIEDAKGSTTNLEKGPEGLALVWEGYSVTIKGAIDGTNTLLSGTATGAEKAQAGVDLLSASFDFFKRTTPFLGFNFRGYFDGTEKARAQTEKLKFELKAIGSTAATELQYINQLVDSLAKLGARKDKRNDLKVIAGLGQSETALDRIGKQIETLKTQQEALNIEAKKYAPGTEENKKFAEQASLVGSTLVVLEANYKKTLAAQDALAASQGYLTSKQKETIPTLQSLSEELKAYKDALFKSLNPEVNTQKWAEATAQVIQIQSIIDRLNSKGATISISVIEKSGLASAYGSFTQLDYYLQQLQTKLVSIPVGSSGADEVISKIGYINALRDAGSRSSAQLERTLFNANADERIRRIQDEQRARDTAYNAQIEALREKTPAELALQQRQKAELASKAGGGNLEAQAQLERMQREEQIAEIQKKQKIENLAAEAEMNRLNEQRRALEAAARADELKAAREVLEARQSSAPYFEAAAARMAETATSAEKIAAAIKGLDGLTVNVNVKGIPGLWTGGPTVAGQTYQVNELGQEGFLSPSGRLTAINKPKNALWTAPSSGTVIPAHIWAGLDAPVGGISTNVRPASVTGTGNGLQRLVNAIRSGMSQSSDSSQAMHEMAAVQARQAIEIGKLSHAVSELAKKDHTINVAVRNTGSTAYLEAVNRRM